MTLVQVDVVGVEAAEAGVERAVQVLAAETRIVRSVADRAEALRRDDHAVTLVLHRAPDDLFGLAACVHVGGVDEVSTRVDEGVDDAATLPFVARCARLVSEHHGAQAGGRHAQTRSTE